MTHPSFHQPDPRLDLVFERVVDVPRELVWTAWTTPAQLKKWFTPAPWTTVDCEIDLRPGGVFRTVMRSPEGQEFPNLGCYLEVVPNTRLVWTNALGPGYRPTNRPADDSCDAFPFTAVLTLEPHGVGTKYRALVIHGDEDGRQEARGNGLPRGLGEGPRSAHRDGQEELSGCARLKGRSPQPRGNLIRCTAAWLKLVRPVRVNVGPSGRRREGRARPLYDSSRSGWGRSLPVPVTSPGRRPAHTCTGDGNGNPAAYWRGRRLRPGG